MSIMERVRAYGAEVVRDEWRISLRKGRLTADALEWLRAHKSDLLREVWPDFDRWEERAAIMEFDGGMTRDEAEATAYRSIIEC